MDRRDEDILPAFRHMLGPGEEVHAAARATDAVLAVTDRRLLVVAGNHVLLDVPIDHVRRIQFDVEKGRPATFTVVPEQPRHEPQVLAIPFGEIGSASEAVRVVGDRFAQLD